MASSADQLFAQKLSDAKATVSTVSPSITAAASADPDAASQVFTACDELGANAAKVAVLFSDRPPPHSEAIAILDSLLQSIMALNSALSNRLVGSIGVLKDTVEKSFKVVGRAVTALMDGMAAVMAGQAPPQRLAVLAEQVRSQAGALKASPLDNKAALCKVVAAAGMSIKDVLREMKELAAEHGVDTDIATLAARLSTANDTTPGRPSATDPHRHDQSSGNPARGTSAQATHSTEGAAQRGEARQGGAAAPGAAGGGFDDDDDDGMLDFEDEGLSEDDHRRLREGLWLLDKVFLVMRAVMARAMQASAAGEGTGGSVEDWQAAAEHIHSMQVAADDLGAAMYPPQDEGNIQVATDTILAAVKTIRGHAQTIQGNSEVISACNALS